ncbi:hydrogenase assembly protein HupF [Mycobacterium sp. 852013-50091_SCH5140682]|uniref:HypC/HybG/HupF family hydrogenase formation chaperone n=1 Tax=Mycobacterium sp. 852013-50091_SCH5140682 TaxID=1834109 RepID=UPI0007EBDF37|nr:HypC/HybG/HupF family hydrogenase formation chaperone [Mycobacterium sp. 852013-50091_SCH5140682]OBC08908.1 hydrogenase assembly protein HupF [Mycobacterium sp. 852013-50091_SCH5140682]
MTAPAQTRITRELAADLAGAALSLARRFSAGATMWCIAPAFAPHAQHISVEFVHPVIVGKRALPAVALTGPELTGQVRVSARAGDVVIAVAGSTEPQVLDVMRRARAWGVTTVWIGNGRPPPIGAADHVLWLDDPDPRLPATGDFVLMYHLLWELTHVCFEHPGLLTARAQDCTDEVCITCSDEGRLAEVIVARPDGTAMVRTAAGVEPVVTALTGALVPGDLILVHAGMAISKVSEQ